MSQLELGSRNRLFINQVREVAELFGFETRNKYQILDEQKRPLGYAAEQGKGLFGFLFRQYFGHWRKFDVHFFSPDRSIAFVAHHPFRWIFQRVEVRDATGRPMGAIQQRFSLFTKRFDVEDARGLTIMEVASPLLKFWTFTFMQRGRQVAQIQKKWSGLFNEFLTDKDVFMVEFTDPAMPPNDRALIVAASIFVDLIYFERKAE